MSQPEIIASRESVLLVVDVQNDFCPGGALAVPDGDQVVPVVNRLAQRFAHVVLSQDWHPPDHFSFASRYPGKRPLDVIQAPYGVQILWPDHCVQDTRGAAFHWDLRIPHAELVLRKGYNRHIDSYSVFFENDRRTATGLAGYLRDRGLSRLYFVGLATDFCVLYSTLDARNLGFEVAVVEDGVRGIDVDGSLAAAWQSMAGVGVRRLREADFA
jgi:nicotinamidase/pyrazinamidase